MNPGFIFVVFPIVEEEDSWRSGDGRRGSLRGLIKSVTEYASAEESDSRERFVILDESGFGRSDEVPGSKITAHARFEITCSVYPRFSVKVWD